MLLMRYLYFCCVLLVYYMDTISCHGDSEFFYLGDFPKFNLGDRVEFYYVEGVFPYTTPAAIVDMAGTLWNSYSLTHAALGVWNKESNKKMTIEMVSEDYVGALLPTIDNNTIYWNNSAVIVMTKPMNESLWMEARLVAVADGAAYSDLVDWLEDGDRKFSKYQPVSLNPFDVHSSTSLGPPLVPYLDSYVFLQGMLQHLAHYGVDLKTFLDVSTTGFSYTVANGATPKYIGWSTAEGGSGITPANITAWFAALIECYEATFATATGGTEFIEALPRCYDNGIAYVYASDTAVYEVPLQYDSINEHYLAPILWRDAYELPDDTDSKASRWDTVDSVVVAVIGVGLLIIGAYYIRNGMKKKRRRIVMQQQEAKVFQSALGINPHNTDETREDVSYFTRPSVYQQRPTSPSASSSIFYKWGRQSGPLTDTLTSPSIHEKY